MDSRVKKKKSYTQKHIIIREILDIVRELEAKFERKGYKVSVATDPNSQISSSLTGEIILCVTSKNNTDLSSPQQRKNNISATVNKKATPVTLTRDKLHGNYTEIIGESPQILEIMQQIESLAATPLRVIISGETGTGKGVVARALHKNSGRSGGMISINCAAIPENLLESELFGHERGAFTSADAQRIGKFERAHNGTLFLDEISEMPLSMQPKLLRVIEEGEVERVGGEKSIVVDVRIVAATNRDLAQAVKDGTFREDLYYRLNVASIFLPTLSERQEDIETLVRHFLKKYRRSCGSTVSEVAPSTLALLKGYPWPGNVRELENTIERASYLVKKGILLPEHLPKDVRTCQGIPMNVSKDISALEKDNRVSVPLGTKWNVMEEVFIRTTLAWLDGNRTKTAEVLGMGIRTLQRKLKKYNT